MAITSPVTCLTIAFIQLEKHSWNDVGSIKENTRPRVSCDGRPCSRDKYCSNHVRFILANFSMATQLSHPQITAHSVIKKMSSSLCNCFLCRRGAVMSLKCSISVGFCLFILLRLKRSNRSNQGICVKRILMRLPYVAKGSPIFYYISVLSTACLMMRT